MPKTQKVFFATFTTKFILLTFRALEMWLPLLPNSSTLHSNLIELSTTLWSHNYGIYIYTFHNVPDNRTVVY